MYAVVVTDYGDTEVLRYRQVEQPKPGLNQVLIKVEATSVNFADIKARYGKKGKGSLPFIPGLDVTGTIVEVGEGVKNFKINQRVIAFPKGGSYAEYVIANTDLTFSIPEKLDFVTAGACPIVSFTAHKLLCDVGRIMLGETVLVHAAAGGIGTTAIQLAKILGAGKVIGTVSKEEKVFAARQAGADYVINTSKRNFVQDVLEITEGVGVDLTLDSIGGRVTENSLLCLARYGRIVHFGNASGETANIQTKDLHASCRSILGFSLGTTRKYRPYLLRDTAEKVLGYIESGKLKITIGNQFPLKEAKIAQELMESRNSIGKILLIPPSSSLNQTKE
ncbi:quinone oxidoreductase family protein [Priestia megaterium]|uniref:quinone oxidoreductase family protein n=1 Tax=Priestia megaterium TaxID=1404 RepID=UPI0025704CC1|nr:zinc-binding dehydrogenase [Priestia megaterium]WJD83550.1 zinc-binding dehydrogenase [Priestia megaterium]